MFMYAKVVSACIQGCTLTHQVGLDSTWPRGGPTDGGTRVTVNGHGFTSFSSAFGVRCRFNEVVVQAAPEEVTTSYTVCILPPRDKAGAVNVTVSLNGVDYDGPLDGSTLLFTYYFSPRIAYLEPPGGPVLGGTIVSLHGSNLSSFGLERTHPADPPANESAICSGPGRLVTLRLTLALTLTLTLTLALTLTLTLTLTVAATRRARASSPSTGSMRQAAAASWPTVRGGSSSCLCAATRTCSPSTTPPVARHAWWTTRSCSASTPSVDRPPRPC